MCDSIVFNVKVMPTRRALAPPSHASASSSASPRASSNRLAPRVFASRRSTYLAYASYVSFDRGARVSAVARGVHSDQSLETPGRPRLDHVPDARSIARVCARTRSSSRACAGFVESARCVAAPFDRQSVSKRSSRWDEKRSIRRSFVGSSVVGRRSSFGRTASNARRTSRRASRAASSRVSPYVSAPRLVPGAPARAVVVSSVSASPSRPFASRASIVRDDVEDARGIEPVVVEPVVVEPVVVVRRPSLARRRLADSRDESNRTEPNRTEPTRDGPPPTRTPFMTRHGSSLPDVSPRADPSRPRARRRETRETATRERARERLRVRRRGRRRGRGR